MADTLATIEWKGQARGGWLSTKGPQCRETLTVGDAQLSFCSRLGDCTFRPDAVERTERAGCITWLWPDNQVHRRVSSYPRRIGFWPQRASTRVVLQEFQRRSYLVT
jgi:hypothetical protein